MRCRCCRSCRAELLVLDTAARPRITLLCRDCYAADGVLELAGGDTGLANEAIAAVTGVDTIPGH